MSTDIAVREHAAITADSDTTARVVESMVVRGDISGLSPEERAKFYIQMCNALGLSAASQPLAVLRLNGKDILYPTRGATDQLARAAWIRFGGSGDFKAAIKTAREETDRAAPPADEKPRSKSRRTQAAPLARGIDHVALGEWAARVEKSQSKWEIAAGHHKRAELWRVSGEIALARGITIGRLCAVMETDDLDATRFLDAQDPARRSERRAAETDRRRAQ